jgi:hypothetical protein
MLIHFRRREWSIFIHVDRLVLLYALGAGTLVGSVLFAALGVR